MIRLKTIFSSLFVVVLYSGNTQTPYIPEEPALLKNENLVIKGDKRIKILEDKYIRINEKEKQLDGYRIQLFSSSGPDSWSRANSVQADFLQIYPDIDAYVIHIKPSFRVRIGDYRSRIDAERFYLEIEESFPDAFIVRDGINFPLLGIEKEEE